MLSHIINICEFIRQLLCYAVKIKNIKKCALSEIYLKIFFAAFFDVELILT